MSLTMSSHLESVELVLDVPHHPTQLHVLAVAVQRLLTAAGRYLPRGTTQTVQQRTRTQHPAATAGQRPRHALVNSQRLLFRLQHQPHLRMRTTRHSVERTPPFANVADKPQNGYC